MTAAQKMEQIVAEMTGFRSIAVAVSGGVDSSVVVARWVAMRTP